MVVEGLQGLESLEDNPMELIEALLESIREVQQPQRLQARSSEYSGRISAFAFVITW